LEAFAQAVHAQLPADAAGPVIFFGPLPFVKCRPAQPYYIYTDGTFFIHYWEYNQDHSHSKKDIERICAAEGDFMRRSAGVWCSSQWVADRITKEYGLTPGKAVFVGTGPGNVPPPVQPVRYENFLVMIAADFERKQGRLAVEAVTDARAQGTEINLKFIGARPPEDVLTLPYVEWCGWLNLGRESDRQRFAGVLSGAGAQILLSRSDLTPLVIPEMANYGKATIAAAVGGIPEMIREGETGWLVNPGATRADIGARIAQIFKKPGELARIGAAAGAYFHEEWSWEATAGRCLAEVKV
jgi:glycosyltransferase involved in cell wall biosynthesis